MAVKERLTLPKIISSNEIVYPIRYVLPEYSTLKVIPHTSVRNYNSASVIKSFTNVYKSLSQCFRVENKQLLFETSVKCAFVIHLSKSSMDFYFIVPAPYKLALSDKIGSTWNTATVKDVANLQLPTDNYVEGYQMQYRYKDCFSLHTDKRSNDLLSSIVSTLDIMQEDDDLYVVFNFLPYREFDWTNKSKVWFKKYLANQIVNKHYRAEDIIDKCWQGFFNTYDQVINSVIGSSEAIGSQTIEDGIRDVLGMRELKLSDASMKKMKSDLIQSQIMVYSTSKSSMRCRNNALSVCQSFKVLDSDNYLISKKIPKKALAKIRLDRFSLGGLERMVNSLDESQNFVQLPGKEILDRYKFIEQTNVTEVIIPEEIQTGFIDLGKATFKGSTTQTYLSDRGELGNLPLILLGPMGSGKSFKYKHLAKNAIDAGEGVIIIDYIKNCELADSVAKFVPKNKLIVLDLTKEQDLQAFAYNEYKITGTTPFEITEAANLHQQQITALIDAVYPGDPLSGPMRRYFTSAANVVLLNDNMSLRDVVRCLEDYDTRHQFIDIIDPAIYPYVSDDVEALLQLDEVDKKTGEVHTRTSKIEHILNRVNFLREDIRLRMMFNKPSSSNIDFAKEMDAGKSIIIKMRADKFRTAYVRNVLVTFFISKIWLACNMRGTTTSKLFRYHMYLDEIFQAPTAYEPLSNILRECRKFRLQLNFTAHQLADLDCMRDGLKSAGASYMLLQNTDKQNFKYLEEEFKRLGFTLDDLLALRERHSLNLITCKDGYCAYESDLYIKE